AINPLAADLPHIASKASVRPRIDLKDVLGLKAHHIPQLDDLRKRMVAERPFEHPLRNDLRHEHPHPFTGCRRVRPAKGALDELVRAARKPFGLRWDLEGAREEVALSLCVFQKVLHVFSPSSNDLCVCATDAADSSNLFFPVIHVSPLSSCRAFRPLHDTCGIACPSPTPRQA